MSVPESTLSVVITGGAADDSFAATVESVSAARLPDMEIICVLPSRDHPAASASGGPEDARVRIVTSDGDACDGRARRQGLRVSSGTHILFLTAGDLLRDPAALGRAHECVLPAPDRSPADVVLFDRPWSEEPSAQEHRSGRPVSLTADAFLRTLTSESEASSVRSRGLFRTRALKDIDRRTNDLDGFDEPTLMLLYAADGASFAVMPPSRPAFEPPGRGRADGRATGDARDPARDVAFCIAIEPIIIDAARRSPNPEPLLLGYTCVREWRVADVLETATGLPEPQATGVLRGLRAVVSEPDIVAAAARTKRGLSFVASHTAPVPLGETPVRNVLLTTNIVTTGGVSGVLLTQARLLIEAGLGVTVVAHRPGSNEAALPAGAIFEQVSGADKAERMRRWAEICRRDQIDLVIDHRVLYSRDWHEYALVSTGARIPTIGWIHNFAARPTYNGNDLHSLLKAYLPVLARLIVLSPLDVAFWKLRGIERTSYLPNPPSPLLLASAGSGRAKRAPSGRRLELVWWGRLEQHTKKVTALVDVASSVKRLGVDFRLRIVGPDWSDMSAEKLRDLVAARSLDDVVEVTGPMHGQDLLDVIDSSDVFVNTSIIEGYPLTLSEAQARGLPVAMYDLPWLALLEGNRGVLSVDQGDHDAMAAAIAALASDPDAYEAASRASITAAGAAVGHDFGRLYAQLIRGELPPRYSPETTHEDVRRLLRLLLFFAENATLSANPAPARGSAREAMRAGGARDASWGVRLERRLTPLGHDLVALFPWAQPAAQRVKHALLRR